MPGLRVTALVRVITAVPVPLPLDYPSWDPLRGSLAACGLITAIVAFTSGSERTRVIKTLCVKTLGRTSWDSKSAFFASPQVLRRESEKKMNRLATFVSIMDLTSNIEHHSYVRHLSRSGPICLHLKITYEP